MLMESMAGICTIHQVEKLFVNDVPTCVKCKAAGTPKLGVTQQVEDPGDAFFAGQPSTAKIITSPTAPAGAVAPVVKGNSLEAHINHAISWLTSAPMPKDIKQFKSLQKSITILQGLLENQNG